MAARKANESIQKRSGPRVLPAPQSQALQRRPRPGAPVAAPAVMRQQPPQPMRPTQPMLGSQAMHGPLPQGVKLPVAMTVPTIYEPGKIYFISPDDRVRQEAPRSAWQIDMLRAYINGVLDHAKKQLVGESKSTRRTK